MGGILLPVVLFALSISSGAEGRGGGARPRCDVSLPAQIDIVDCRLARAVEQALNRSASLQRVVDRVGALQGRVYIRTAVSVAPGGTHPLLGGLSHQVVMAGPYCLLHVTVLHGHDDKALATIGHELQHALEVLEHPEARTQPDVDELFVKIGGQVAAGVVETQAAVAIEAAVLRELRLATRRIPFAPLRTRNGVRSH